MAKLQQVDVTGWKQAVEGMVRGRIGPYQQRNIPSGEDSIREYTNRGRVVARMTVHGCNTDKPGYACERTFEVTKKIRTATSDIYIPTEEDWDEYDELLAQPGFDPAAWLREKGITE